MSVMTFALTFAGVLQVHLQRVLGEGYMDVQDQLAMFYWVRLGSGVFVLLSALMFLWALFVPGRQRVGDEDSRKTVEWSAGVGSLRKPL